jgi:hypothetical protein
MMSIEEALNSRYIVATGKGQRKICERVLEESELFTSELEKS